MDICNNTICRTNNELLAAATNTDFLAGEGPSRRGPTERSEAEGPKESFGLQKRDLMVKSQNNFLHIGYYMNKRWVKKGTTTKGWRKTGATRKVSKAVQKYVKKEINTELERKQLAVNFANQVPISNTVGTKYNITASVAGAGAPGQQGTGDFNRLGAKIRIKQVEFRAQLQVAATVVEDMIRVIVVRDRQTTGIQPTAGEILYDVSAGMAITSPYKQSTIRQYEILHDEVIRMWNDTSAVPALAVHFLHFKKTFSGLGKIQEYYPNATAGTIADIVRGSVTVLLFSAGGVTNAINVYSNVIFTDA